MSSSLKAFLHGSSMNNTREISCLEPGRTLSELRCLGHQAKPSILSHQAQFSDGGCLAVYSTTVVMVGTATTMGSADKLDLLTASPGTKQTHSSWVVHTISSSVSTLLLLLLSPEEVGMCFQTPLQAWSLSIIYSVKPRNTLLQMSFSSIQC